MYKKGNILFCIDIFLFHRLQIFTSIEIRKEKGKIGVLFFFCFFFGGGGGYRPTREFFTQTSQLPLKGFKLCDLMLGTHDH